MRLVGRAGLFVALVTLLGCDMRAEAVAQPTPAQARPAVVVELYESQGCSSCPPAIANVNALSSQGDLLTLIFSVTYWDQLGWKDTFSQHAFTDRQYAYAHGLQHDNVFTPQVVLNGRHDLVGIDRAGLEQAIHAQAALAQDVSIAAANGSVSLHGGAPAAPADVWLVRYDPRSLAVPIGAGENSGRTIAHIDVVKELVRLGSFDGAPHSFAIPQPAQSGLKTAILVQGQNGGPIIAAALLDL